jgi:hypothetical protein
MSLISEQALICTFMAFVAVSSLFCDETVHKQMCAVSLQEARATVKKQPYI